MARLLSRAFRGLIRAPGEETPPGTYGCCVTVEIRMDRLDAVIFDLDGVITDTASVHAAAWKRMFDQFLADRADREGEDQQPFSADDYYLYVDGKPRYDGVESFLASRGISLPRGEPGDPPAAETACGLGNRKDELFLARLREARRQLPFHPRSRCCTGFARAGVERRSSPRRVTAPTCSRRRESPTSSTRRSMAIDADELGLNGKPDPAVFLEAARRLGVEPARAAVVEDALAGVEAGRRGRFGLVIGVDRGGHGAALRERGADVVVGDLGEVRVSATGRASGERPGRRRGADPERLVARLRGLRPGAGAPARGALRARKRTLRQPWRRAEATADGVHYPGTYAAGCYNRADQRRGGAARWRTSRSSTCRTGSPSPSGSRTASGSTSPTSSSPNTVRSSTCAAPC